MDQSIAIKSQVSDTISPAQLFIGSPVATVEKVHSYLQSIFCSKKGCGSCLICLQISNHQFHSMRWFAPDNMYTREQLEPVFEALAFRLETNQQFFVVLEHADALTLSCANSLLKSLEEPPTGYHFILTTQRPDDILPTIRSRCVNTVINAPADKAIHQELLTELCSGELGDATLFLKMLDQAAITERETLELLDSILEYWISEYKKAITQIDSDKIIFISNRIDAVRNALTFPPMPGSSKLLLKNLYLRIKLAC